jgi:hypothetical protein
VLPLLFIVHCLFWILFHFLLSIAILLFLLCGLRRYS